MFTRGCVAASLALLSTFVSAQIIETLSGKETNESALIRLLQSADIVLLGELHDNRLHHQLRGQLIAQFADTKRSIVSEHIPAPSKVVFRSDTKADLEAAGFDPEGWEWPAHQSLYDAIRAKNLTVVGGNLPKAEARKIFLQGVTGLSERMAQTYAQSRLDADAERALDRDLVEGHCGQLPDKYLLRMRFAQRITDLSLTHALLDNRPAVLVAGNGHVRKDYGVPQILSSVNPSLKVISIGFLEQGSDPKDLLHSVAGQYDFIWITERAERKNPCENFNLK
jgi:uncharacterized iron-regulated protein